MQRVVELRTRSACRRRGYQHKRPHVRRVRGGDVQYGQQCSVMQRLDDMSGGATRESGRLFDGRSHLRRVQRGHVQLGEQRPIVRGMDDVRGG